ncbi:MAG TPA: alpha/beta hydrolase [Oligoflexia bacterium]|nr:alpha/beta hydrolase [Oligoflexia bacterium]HMP49291.1 alpha/beta hydrolase [Oligoflexia bacterium]
MMYIDPSDASISKMEVYSEILGSKQHNVLPLIILHGWWNSSHTIRPLAEKLQTFTEIHLIDLPGHGNTPPPKEIWNMQNFAECIKEYLDKKDIKKAHFIGHSFGGKTIIKLAFLYPQLLDHIVLIGASGIRPKPKLKRKIYFSFLALLRKFIRFKNTKLGQRIYQNWYIPRFASRDYLNSDGIMRQTFVKTLNEELKQELTDIMAPTLLIWGENDDESPPQVGKEMASLIKNSHLVLIPNQGHHPFLGGSGALVAGYIRDFLFKGVK